MKIIFIETEKWEQEYLEPKFNGHELIFRSGLSLLPEDKDADVVCNFVASPLTSELIASMPNLKFVATRSTGYDHVDLKACEEKNIAVSNVPAYGENTVAEFAFALILALSRKLYPAIKRVREQGSFNTDGLKGFDVKGKILGVVGTGRIGAQLIKMAKGFDMEVLGYDPYPNLEMAKAVGFSYVSLEELLQQSDIVSLHVPYMPATHHLLNQEKFNLFKPGAILINTARGGLVETESLVKSLNEKRLAGAGIDVLEEEGFVKEEAHMIYAGHPNEQQLRTVLADHQLMQMDNVLLTPHNAFNTQEALIRILDTTILNIENFVAGKPTNLVKIK